MRGGYITIWSIPLSYTYTSRLTIEFLSLESFAKCFAYGRYYWSIIDLMKNIYWSLGLIWHAPQTCPFSLFPLTNYNALSFKIIACHSGRLKLQFKCLNISGLSDHDNYHECCRLLGRFKVNYQVYFFSCFRLSCFLFWNL